MRFIHAADLHLDSPLAGLRERAGEHADRLVGATRRAFEGLVDFAVDERVDLVVIAGDVFDGDWPDHTTGLFFVRMLARLKVAGILVAMIRGNHDAASVISKRLTWPDNVREFSSRVPETWTLPELGVAIHGQSFADRAIPQNLAAGYPEPVPGLFNIGLLHTSATGRPGHDTYAPCEPRDLTAKGYDYWALGHVHTREVLCEQPHVIFPGNLQGRHINEPGAKGFTLVTVEGGRVRHVESIAVDVVRWARVTVDVSSASTLDETCPLIGRALQSAVDEADGRMLALRLVLTGASPAHRVLAGDPERLEAECLSLALQTRGDVWIERVEVETLLPEVTPVSGEGFHDLLQLLHDVRADHDERALIREALEQGLGKLPGGVRSKSGLDELTPEQFERILADAEAMLLHHLTTEPVQP
jgi:DNA repair exonuclease SbcCD nuclease subunit